MDYVHLSSLFFHGIFFCYCFIGYFYHCTSVVPSFRSILTLSNFPFYAIESDFLKLYHLYINFYIDFQNEIKR